MLPFNKTRILKKKWCVFFLDAVIFIIPNIYLSIAARLL